jgi:hypothetical protein
MQVTDNTKTLANAIAEIDQLRQKLDAAEKQWHYYQSLIKHNGFDGITDLLAKHHALEKVICEAREQIPLGTIDSADAWRLHVGRNTKALPARLGGYVYAAPVPAMPIQDDIKLTGFIHDLKTDPAVFDDVEAGRKTHEIRFNDRDYKVGDKLVLHQTEHTGEEIKKGAPLVFTGKTCVRVVSHVIGGYGLSDGWVILSFAPQSEVKPSC